MKRRLGVVLTFAEAESVIFRLPIRVLSPDDDMMESTADCNWCGWKVDGCKNARKAEDT